MDIINEIRRIMAEQSRKEKELMKAVDDGRMSMDTWREQMAKMNELFKLDVCHVLTDYEEA